MQPALGVEDLPTARAWLADILVLAFSGVEVTTADNLAHARAAAEATRFDLVLVVLHLPDGSCVELSREITDRSPSTDCVVATIDDDAAHLFPALQAGARGYLLKENDKQQLVMSLKGIVAGTPPLSPKVARRVLQQGSSGRAGARSGDPLPRWASPLGSRRLHELGGVDDGTERGVDRPGASK